VVFNSPYVFTSIIEEEVVAMMKRIVLVSVACCMPLIGHAAHRVVVESRQVAGESGSVTVGIYIENSDSLQGVMFPMEIRSTIGGAFIADTLSVRTANRLTSALTGITVTSYMPAADNNRYWQCQGGGYSTRGKPDFVSPDAFLHGSVYGDGDPELYPGNDGAPPGGTPSILVTFGVNGNAGTFEIDTTCITPANRLEFYSSSGMIKPEFTKGVIEVGCACDCHTDPQCDGYHDIVDWLKIKNVAQGSSGPILDPNPFCPVVTTDVNCDGVTNNTDKNLMYGVVFLGDNPDSVFCNPCP
jgi:hypothetical protein